MGWVTRADQAQREELERQLEPFHHAVRLDQTINAVRAKRERARQLELARLKAQWKTDPAGWVRMMTGEWMWSGQRMMVESVRDHPLTVVRACHDAGKSFCASRSVLWWLDVHPPGDAFVVTSAPTASQVRAILWREIGKGADKIAARARMGETPWGMYGAPSGIEWHLPNLSNPRLKGELVAFGRKPADYDPTAFQGIHAKYVLIVLDECCHDDQTEVLTDVGWKFFAELDGTEQLLSLDQETGVAEYHLPTKLIKKRYVGQLHHYHAKNADFCVTPDHRMIFDSQKGVRHELPVVRLFNSKSDKYIPRQVNWAEPDVSFFTLPAHVDQRRSYLDRPRTWPARDLSMDDWLEFLGWWCSEGHLIRVENVPGQIAYHVGITQQKPANFACIQKLCKVLGFAYKIYGSQIRLDDQQLGAYLAEIGSNQLDRRVPDFIRHTSAKQIGIFLEAYVRGDGYRTGHKDEALIYTSSKQMASDLHELCLKTGRNSRFWSRGKTVSTMADGRIIQATTDGYVVCWSNCSSRLELFEHNMRLVDYDGHVYCATVPPHHTLLTRRNGHVIWSGNCGVPKSLWDASLTLATNPDTCRILAIGNPDDSTSVFAAMCKPNSGWNVLRISAWDTPMFTGELDQALEDGEITDEEHEELSKSMLSKRWVEERGRTWGTSNPLYVSKIDAEFPENGDKSLCQLSWLERAREATFQYDMTGPFALGVDVATSGKAKTVIVERRGANLSIRDIVRGNDPIETANLVCHWLNKTGAWHVAVDGIGVGSGTVARLRELNRPVHEIIGSQAAIDTVHFANLRSELYWRLREMLEAGQIGLPNHDDLIAQLAEIRWETGSGGRVQVEPKEAMEARGLPSPDEADACVYALFMPPHDG